MLLADTESDNQMQINIKLQYFHQK